MDGPSNLPVTDAVARREPHAKAANGAGYVVTNEMYNTLYDLYYQRCAQQQIPCFVIVRNGSHCRLDLDMTCSQQELTDWAQHHMRQILVEVQADEIYADGVYCWATRVPNRLAEGLARKMLTILEDDRASTPA
jgi:hypothetical protein